MFFKKFPFVKYDFTRRTDKTPTIDILQDISTKVNLFLTADGKEAFCNRLTVNNGELPEHVSYRVYGTPDLAWTIMYINNLGDVNSEWCMSDIEVINYAKRRYGVNNLDAIHHYEKLSEKIVMDKNYIIDNYGIDELLEVTNIDHESFLNDQKRYIYVIKPSYVGRFITLFESKLA
jgi:hypothetical protein